MVASVATASALSMRVERKTLLNALSRAVRVAPKKCSMPVLTTVHLSALHAELVVRVTDLDIFCEETLPCQVSSPGAICVAVKELLAAVKGFDAQAITLESTGLHLAVTAGGGTVRLNAMTADEWPKIPSSATDVTTMVDPWAISEAMRRTWPMASTDETRYVLNGVLFERVEGGKGNAVNVVSTDGHRLQHDVMETVGVGTNQRHGMIVMRKAAAEIEKLALDKGLSGDVMLGWRFVPLANAEKAPQQAGWSIVRRAGVTLISRCIDGRFPDYRQVTPEKATLTRSVEVNRKDLMRIVKAVAKRRSMSLEKDDAGVRVQTQDPDVGETNEVCAGIWTGAELKIGCQPSYLLEALDAFTGHAVTISFSEGIDMYTKEDNTNCRPFTVTCKDEKTTAVVMPMRI